MARVYVGDIGTVVTPQPITQLPKDLDLSQLTFRQLCNLAVACNIDVRDMIGVENCIEHEGMVLLADKEMPSGYNLFEDCKYCKNCWQFFRYKEKQVL
jgi:hypothetical protein